MLLSFRKHGLTSLFKEVRVFKVAICEFDVLRPQNAQGSPFDPHPQRLPIFHLILGGKSESLLRKPGSA